MKKPIIIIGSQNSGKSFLAKTLSLTFEKPFTLAESLGHKYSGTPFPFQNLTAFHDLIIIEDLQNIDDAHDILNSNVLEVFRQYKSTIYLHRPQIIITMNHLGITDEFIKAHASKYTFIDCNYTNDRVFEFIKLTQKFPQA